MEQQGATRVEIAYLGDERKVTATFTVTTSGKFFPFQLVYEGKTEMCHPQYMYTCIFPPKIDMWHGPKLWSNTELTKHFIQMTILPYTECEE